MASKMKVCVACDNEKPSTDYRRGQFVCKKCENDPTVEYKKKCNDCEETKSSTLFSRNRLMCKDCERIRKNPPKERPCSECGQMKILKEFRRGQPVCKICEDNPRTTFEKKCRDCEETKPNTLFRKNRKLCIDCERSYGRGYRHATTKAKEWAGNNKERMTELQSRWYEENKERIREKERERKIVDQTFKDVKSYRRSVNSLFYGENKMNKKLAIDHVSFVNWLEFCFKDGMTKENYSDVWQIDHVLPLDLLYDSCKSECVDIIRDNPVSQKLLFSWYNTFPLEKSENRLKGNSITVKHLSKHVLILRRFLKANKQSSEANELYKSYMKLIRQIVEKLRQSP